MVKKKEEYRRYVIDRKSSVHFCEKFCEKYMEFKKVREHDTLERHRVSCPVYKINSSFEQQLRFPRIFSKLEQFTVYSSYNNTQGGIHVISFSAPEVKSSVLLLASAVLMCSYKELQLVSAPLRQRNELHALDKSLTLL